MGSIARTVVAAAPSLVVVVLDQANAYQTQLLDGVRSAFEGQNWGLIVYVNDPFAHAIRSPGRRLLRSGRAAGVITTMLSDPDSQRDLDAILDSCRQVPVVHVGAPLPGGSSVGTDNAAGIALVMAHLADVHGARRVAIVRGPDHHSDSAAREAAVRVELASRGLALPDILDGEFDRDATYAATAQFVAAGTHTVDAIVAFNDRSAAGVLDALNDNDIRVPDNVLLTGFDDDGIAAECVPALTTVNQRLFDQGALAARCLLERMAGSPPHGHIVVQPELVVRGSTDRCWVAPETPAVPTRTTIALMNRARSISRAFMGCRTVNDVLRELSASIPQLGLRRCLVVLHTHNSEGAPTFGTLVFRHLDGQTAFTPDAKPFDLRGAPPIELIEATSHGTLIVQPLNVGTDDLGYVLFEQDSSDAFVGEMLRMDLGRAIDTVQRIENHTDVLEGLVSARTQELREQIAVRERAEDNLRRANLELSRLSKSDGLTLIANRSAFDDYLQEQWDAAIVDGGQLSLLFIDVDHFKQLNDTHGHVVGDQCLRVAARCLHEATWSPGDLAARFGGDEFAAVLPSTDPSGASAVAARFKKTISGATVTGPTGTEVGFTVSIGVATVRPSRSMSPTQLIAKADAALYEAKVRGRDQVVSARLVEAQTPQQGS